MRIVRAAPADAWLAGGLVVLSIAASLVTTPGPPYRDFDMLGTGIAAASALCLLWRKVTPVLVVAATSVLVIVNTSLGFSVAVVQWPSWIALFTCFSLLGWWARLAAVAFTLLAVCGYALLDRGPVGVLELSGITMCFLIATVGGDAARSRRAYAAVLAERVLLQERTRLARELHDALGHAVNVMVMQAGVGRRVFAENPAFAHEALQHIETGRLTTLLPPSTDALVWHQQEMHYRIPKGPHQPPLWWILRNPLRPLEYDAAARPPERSRGLGSLLVSTTCASVGRRVAAAYRVENHDTDVHGAARSAANPEISHIVKIGSGYTVDYPSDGDRSFPACIAHRANKQGSAGVAVEIRDLHWWYALAIDRELATGYAMRKPRVDREDEVCSISGVITLDRHRRLLRFGRCIAEVVDRPPDGDQPVGLIGH